jgi:hypothetical protein
MKIDELIQNYETEVAAEKVRREQEIENLKLKYLTEFTSLVREHAGEILDELNPVMDDVGISLDQRNQTLYYSLPVSFTINKGAITASYSLKAESWSKFDLDFGGMYVEVDHHVTIKEYLPATDRDLGNMFLNLRKADILKGERHRVEQVSRLHSYLNFHGMNLQGVEKQLKNGIEEFPRHAVELTAAANIRKTEIADRTRQEVEYQLARDLRESEEDQLQRLVDYAWQGPFTIYRIDYGARMDGVNEEGSEVYVNHFYTLQANGPFKHLDGLYYRAFGDGEYGRLIKPERVISTEEIKITKADQAPLELRKRVTLQSKNITDVSLFTFLPPTVLFAFDYDALIVAIETQDTNDATQEDIS